MKKIITSLLAFILSISSVFVLTSCAAIKGMEEEFNVVFIHEGKIVASDTVTQFKNTLTPEIDEAYIPDGYKFFGWTAYSMNEIDPERRSQRISLRSHRLVRQDYDFRHESVANRYHAN